MHDPHSHERKRLASGIVRTSHLCCQRNHLRHKQDQQHGHVPVSGEEAFHSENYSTTETLSKTQSGDGQSENRAMLLTQCSDHPITRFLISYSIEILRSSLKSLSILPVPSTTLASGSSAIETGRPVSSRIRLSRFFSRAPPPVSTMPRSLISALSSGGVRSSATRMAVTIVATHSPRASRISPSPIETVRGTPSIRLRPLISIARGLCRGDAEPTSIFIASAARPS